jgi:hypothetical protein
VTEAAFQRRSRSRGGRWDERAEIVRSWIQEQTIVLAAVRATGASTRDAELLLQALQRCADAMRSYSGEERARAPAGRRQGA